MQITQPIKKRLRQRSDLIWWSVIVLLTTIISIYHFMTPPSEGHLHLILTQLYLIPVLIGALLFGVPGGLGTALAVTLITTPHIFFQWVGGLQHDFLGYLQILIINAIGYFTGLKSAAERRTRERLSRTADELRQTLETLNHKTSELAELEEQMRQSERLSVIGELMASLAHELRNPLASIRGSVDILKKELEPQQFNSEFFSILATETERMSAVVESYLGLARKHQGKNISYDAIEVLESTVMMLEARARREQKEIAKYLDTGPVMLVGDPGELRQIVANLLLNSIQAIGEGARVSITAKIPDSLNEIHRNLQISVSDAGPGIDPDQIESIFKPFYSTKEQGTGLGLSIVKRIAENRQWKIEAENNRDEGALFTLTIPLRTDGESR